MRRRLGRDGAGCERRRAPKVGTHCLALRAFALLAALTWVPSAGMVAQEADPDVLVLAASSLTDVLPRIADAWTPQSGARVEFSFAATSRLAPQVLDGRQADVFISASERWMDWVEERGGINPDTRRVVATNGLVVVVPAESGAQIQELDDLTDTQFSRVALADENVPAGRYARAALTRSGVWDHLQDRVVRGGSVRGALEWAARGEVDAAVVYATDARGDARVRTALELDTSAESPRYLAAVVAASDAPAAAADFLDFMTSAAGSAALAEAGFGPPSDPSLDGAPAPASVVEDRSLSRTQPLVGDPPLAHRGTLGDCCRVGPCGGRGLGTGSEAVSRQESRRHRPAGSVGAPSGCHWIPAAERGRRPQSVRRVARCPGHPGALHGDRCGPGRARGGAASLTSWPSGAHSKPSTPGTKR